VTQKQVQAAQQQAQPSGQASAAGITARRIQVNMRSTSSGSRSVYVTVVQVLMRCVSHLTVSWSCCRRMTRMTAQHKIRSAVTKSKNSTARHCELRLPPPQQQQEEQPPVAGSLSVSQ
jgi:hypothetical protein